MNRIIALIGLSFLVACAAPLAEAEPEFDNCLMTNMAAVAMLEDRINESEEFLTRAKMTLENYKSIRASLAEQRGVIANLLTLRADMLRDDMLDESAQAARTSVLMRNYARSADAAIADAKANETPATELAAQATSCAQKLAE